MAAVTRAYPRHYWVSKDPIPGTGGTLWFEGVEYRVTRITLPVRIVLFRAYLGGTLVAEAAKFTTLLKRLGKL